MVGAPEQTPCQIDEDGIGMFWAYIQSHHGQVGMAQHWYYICTCGYMTTLPWAASMYSGWRMKCEISTSHYSVEVFAYHSFLPLRDVYWYLHLVLYMANGIIAINLEAYVASDWGHTMLEKNHRVCISIATTFRGSRLLHWSELEQNPHSGDRLRAKTFESRNWSRSGSADSIRRGPHAT